MILNLMRDMILGAAAAEEEDQDGQEDPENQDGQEDPENQDGQDVINK